MIGYVYILQSAKNGRFYIGSTGDVNRRLIEHNWGQVKATRNKGPWELKLVQSYRSLKEARRVEYRVKKLKRRDYLERMINSGRIITR
jgi:putative endonuclease